jgi:hypothetical protein
MVFYLLGHHVCAPVPRGVKMHLKLSIVAALFLCSACYGTANQSIGGAGELFGASGPDTVAVESHGANSTLVWFTVSDGWRMERWRSRVLHGAQPAVRLVDLNGDGSPDLFWTVDYEEIVGGMALLSDGDSARVAYASDDQEVCRPPQLEDVNSDGVLDLVRYIPFGLEPSLCRGDATTSVCQDLPTEWREVWINTAGSFAPDSLAGARFYQSLASEYSRAATTLQHRVESLQRSGGQAGPCDSGVIERLRGMAERARRLGGTSPR